MKNLSMQELHDLMKTKRPAKYILASENQTRETSVEYSLEFHQLNLLYNPDCMFFRGNNTWLRLNGVKKISLADKESILGTVFHVKCSDSAFTVIAQ